jgi:trehalose-6-phosphate synthase
MRERALPLTSAFVALAAIAFLLSLVQAPNWPLRFLFRLAEVLAVSAGTLLVARLFLRGPIERLAQFMRLARDPREGPAGAPQLSGLLEPLAREAAALAEGLQRAEAVAEQEAKLRYLAHSLWTPQRLREHARARLGGRPFILVANREPYRHVRKGGATAVEMPASGLVTGVEPILRACGGTWVAHGDGEADRETADSSGRLPVPPERPQYTLRRVWLAAEEVKGYYEGFANEGLWPLCHIAHTRPVFKAADWAHYQEVNKRFAAAALEEAEGQTDPVFLIQDYHFALLPRLLKKARPDARVALFWHIPFPNPEAFAICPWQTELLDGMLGADLIGFHTQFHCNNFFDTADRALECRIDRERFAVRRGGQASYVKPFPISIAFPDEGPAEEPAALRRRLLKAAGAPPAERLAVGVDRLDYTKGILERFWAIEKLLEENPSYVGRFTFAELGAPTRTTIPRYRDFVAEVESEAARINARFPGTGARPILLLARHHSHEEILPWYRAADACLVTSLHDGMNLVAKEFVASRADDDGVLVLSRFTGAARELGDALLVNPYDAEGTADALAAALEMPASERNGRMSRLRRTVRENNVYRWAGALITELTVSRAEEPAS